MRLQDVGVCILWDATPQTMLGPESEIRTRQDFDRVQQRDKALVGSGYFYIDVWDITARLKLLHSTAPGYWQGEIIEQSLISDEELRQAVEDAGGALNWSGHYPLPGHLIERIQNSLGTI